MGQPQLLLQQYWEEEEGEDLLRPGSMDPARLCGVCGQQRDAQSNSIVVLRGTLAVNNVPESCERGRVREAPNE